MDWKTTAAVFPGQGSQAVGMVADFAGRYALARETFAAADDVLGFGLSAICWQGPAEALDQTINTQPALFVSSLAIWRVLQDLQPNAQPAWLAGHSLGELSALCAAGALSFEAGLRLVHTRGRLMQLAGEANPGAMAAVLGLPAEQVGELCSAVSRVHGGTVVLANDNCPGQAVVSGEKPAVDQLVERAAAAGARRAVKLAVSVAAHSPLMASAADDFARAVNDTPFTAPRIPVYGNVAALPLAGPGEIRHELAQQLTRTVRWTETMQNMIDAGAQTFIEVGAGNVLTGLLRRIDRSKARINLNSTEALDRLLASLAGAET